VWTGLLLRVDNEAQLAYVIGHEFAHYLKRHSIQQWRDLRHKAAATTFFNALTAAAGVGFIGDLGTLLTLGTIFAFSREEEREADLVGVALVKTAGYDVREASRIWQALLAEQTASKVTPRPWGASEGPPGRSRRRSATPPTGDTRRSHSRSLSYSGARPRGAPLGTRRGSRRPPRAGQTRRPPDRNAGGTGGPGGESRTSLPQHVANSRATAVPAGRLDRAKPHSVCTAGHLRGDPRSDGWLPTHQAIRSESAPERISSESDGSTRHRTWRETTAAARGNREAGGAAPRPAPPRSVPPGTRRPAPAFAVTSSRPRRRRASTLHRRTPVGGRPRRRPRRRAHAQPRRHGRQRPRPPGPRSPGYQRSGTSWCPGGHGHGHLLTIRRSRVMIFTDFRTPMSNMG
jgi:hypothetical protein